MKQNTTTRRSFIGRAATVTVGSLALPSLACANQTNTPVARVTGTVKTKDGTQLYVKDWGRGRPVILLAAWPLSADCGKFPNRLSCW